MKIDVNGTQLYYEVCGSGSPLIMLHGNGETHSIFDKAVPLLSQSFTVYSIDTRGHGQSAPVSEFHYDDMTEDIHCFIEALSLEAPIFYGFSDGGIIGLLLASRYPELLSRLIISGANLSPDGIRPGWLKLFKVINRMANDPKMKMMLDEPCITSQQLNKISVPTLVLAGSRDMVRRDHTIKIAAGIKNSRLQILKGHGHGSYIVHKAKIAHIILEDARANKA